MTVSYLRHTPEYEDEFLRLLQGRPTQTTACNPFASDSGFATTDLQVTYEIQTQEPIRDLSSSFANRLTLLVEGAAVEAIHELTCAIGQDEVAEDNELSRLAQCVYSITAAEREELTFCENNSIPNCVAFAGDIKVFHQPDCTADLKLAAVLALEQGADSAPFLEAINGRLDQNAVTRVGVLETLSDGQPISAATMQANRNAVNDQGLSTAGLVLVILAGFFLCACCACLFLCCKRRRTYNRDAKSVETDPSAEDPAEQLEEQEEAQTEEPPTSFSERAHPSSQMEEPQDKPNYKEFEATEESMEAVAPPTMTPQKRGLFGRRKKSQINLESVSFVRVASAKRCDDDEDESMNSCSL